MSPERAQHLLQGYAYGTLTRAELQELSVAALDDEDLFAQMAHADEQRQILAVPGVREEALRIVRQSAEPELSWRDRLAAWFRPGTLLPAAAVAMLVMVLIVKYKPWDRGDKHSQTDVNNQLYQPEARAVADLQPAAAGPAFTISSEPWMNSTVTEATNISFRVQLAAAAALVVVQQMPDGRARFVYPESLTEPVDLTAGEHRIALEASPPGSGIAGNIRLVVAAFEPSTDVRLPDVSLDQARGRMTRREISYAVRAP